MRVPYLQSIARCRYVHNVEILRDLRPLAPDEVAVRTGQLPAAESSPEVVEVAKAVKPEVVKGAELLEAVKTV